MSKTTIALLIILLIGIGALLFVMYGPKQNSIITSLTQSIHNSSSPTPNTTLSFSTFEKSIKPGQTVSVAVLLHNANPHPDLAQLELAYDPTVLTVDSLIPGDFFVSPMVALQNIDPITGRISYALRCPDTQTANATADCVNHASPTLAVITFTVNTYAVKNTTTLSFLPKTVIRTHNGRDILQNKGEIQLTITKSLYPAASSSAATSPIKR